jgi:deferrochelatase/peroxidase EfeB
MTNDKFRTTNRCVERVRAILVIDNGSTASLFVSNAGFGVGSAKGEPPVFKQATVLRLDLDIPEGKPPVVKRETVIGSGFGAQADQGVFLIGPTGLALSSDGKLLYVSDAIGNRINAIDDPITRDTSAGVGRQLTADGSLRRPLAMTTITLEHWDQMERGFQESVVGRQKYSGAPLGKKNEFDQPDLDAVDKDGNPVIPDNAHVRLANRAVNNGAQILRRTYSYNDGTNFYIERWPPWRQETEYDSGLIFIAHQRDPRTGFIPINEKLAKLDMMNQFTTHVGSGIFACPPGVQGGSFFGAALFDV